MQYLIGSAKELAPVWQAWGWAPNAMRSSRSSSTTRRIVYGVTGSGDRLALYPPEFKPSEIAHDVPVLAAL